MVMVLRWWGIFWDLPKNPALSPHLSSAMQGGILRETSLSWVVCVPRILYAAEQSRFVVGTPSRCSSHLVWRPSQSVCPPGERSGPSHLSPCRSGGDSLESECQPSDRLRSYPALRKLLDVGHPFIFIARGSFPLLPSPLSQAEV